MSSPIEPWRLVESERADGWGAYPSRRAVERTRVRVATLSCPGWLKANETVVAETRAAFATSWMVTRLIL